MSSPRRSPTALRKVTDMEGWVFFRNRLLSRKRKFFARLNGTVLSLHHSEKSAVEAHYCVEGCSITSSPFFSRCTLSISLRPGTSIFVQPQLKRTLSSWQEALQNASQQSFEALYTVGEKIGEGHFATVYKAIRKSDNAVVAVKTVEKNPYNMQAVRELDREMYAMKHLDHESVISAHDVFNTTDKVHIIMDILEGGTLKDLVQENGGYISEDQALPIVRQILHACAYFHKQGYVHRDLKLENVLCETATIDTVRVKVADFGFVNFVNDPRHECLRSMVGTPVYVAPEIARGVQYGAAVDMYAIGVMLYRMLCGRYPYDAEEEDETLRLVVNAKLELRGSIWTFISPECKTFVKALLNAEPSRRFTAEQALEHPWLLRICTKPLKNTSCLGTRDSKKHDVLSPVTPSDDIEKRAGKHDLSPSSIASSAIAPSPTA